MRGIMGIIAVASVTLGAIRGDQAPSNKLSPKEAAEGWLLLFDGESTYGWTATAAAKMGVKGGVLRCEVAGTIQTTTAFHEFAVQFQCRITGAQAHEDVCLVFNGQTAKMAFPNEKGAAWKNAKLMVAGNRFKFNVTGGSTEFPATAG